ncbi:efflux RND transporter periplasmic adaptor subunit [Ancylobacter mangrovi]|uniref:efflux RND transporter periplasmic adaptor subunit n=1 Tax=Ancylobacter mangrovi TaxID=2972472 RepID=UPI002162E144|nr:efflux RND transporter periplasmic adaptor subunit [Ancylobacter mangrovi]MCS0503223.1 efflux RND transporter periplasmic adaptor subunit [Ancylobacter mangrovi]
MSARDDSPSRGRAIVRSLLLLVGLAVLGAGFFVWRESAARAAAPNPATVRQAAPVPVTVATVARRDMPVVLSGLGTVQASQTINIHARVDGTLQSVDFTEGQDVKAGDVLAKLDPRLAEASLGQAQATKEKDTAQLRGAEADLNRYTELAQKDFASKQQLDQQQATVDQLKATISADDAAIRSAQTTLGYMTITAPADGHMGIRQVDAGNIVHATDSTPIAVLTTLKPVAVVFTLPEKNLGAVQRAMAKGPLTVVARGEDGSALGTGTLAVVDNQIDTSTGTLRLKAIFTNQDERLWPGAFVHVDLTVDKLKDVLAVPVAAVQRGPDGLFAWVIDTGDKATVRPIETSQVARGFAKVEKGLTEGERVVTDGQYRLRPNAHVAATDAGPKEELSSAAAPAAP